LKRRKASRFATVSHPSHPAIPHSGAADLTRQRLIRASLELFTTRGYHDTTTAQIAKKAGVAEGYRAAQRWAAKIIQETARDAEAASARAQLTAIAHGLVDGAARETAIVKLGLLESLDAVLDDESHRTAREFWTALERVIAEGKAQGSVGPSDRRSSNNAISGGTNTRSGTPTTPMPRLT
jgi:AcrR family transcriptional regulator